MAIKSDSINFLKQAENIKFQKEARGYSKDQVMKTLSKLPPLADEIVRLQQKLKAAEERAQSAEARLVEAQTPTEIQAPSMLPVSQDFDETLRNTLVSAQRTADTTIREAQEEAERLRTEAEFQSNSILAESKDQASELIKDAEEQRERMVTEVEEEKARLLKEASDSVKKRKEEIESELVKAHESERESLISQINELTETHKLLQSDVVRFEDHLEKRREEVRKALSEITQVLDDPDKLRVEDPIDSADLPEHNDDNYPPIAVDVESVDELEKESIDANEALKPAGDEIDPDELDSFMIVSDEDEEDYEIVDLGESGMIVEDYIVEDVYQDSEDPNLVYQEVEEVQLQNSNNVPPNPPGTSSGDPYLDELKRVTSEEPTSNDPIASFLDEDEEKSSGWFGRRK